MSSRVGRSLQAFEPLEQRRLLSGTGVADAVAGNPQVYPPHSTVAGQSMEQWAADWWSLIFETPVHTGSVITHPNLDTTGAHGGQGDVGDVFFLFQSFVPGEIERSVTVPAGKPVFVPVMPMEFSNYDTADPNGNFPGDYSADELAGFAAESAKSIITRGDVFASIDGAPVRGMQAHREASPVTYTLPAEDNLLQFFGLPFSGPVSPASVDGFYLMLEPLTPGSHELVFGGSIPTNPAPLLSDFSVEVTYHLTVVDAAALPDGAPTGWSVAPPRDLFASQPIAGTRIADLLEPEVLFA